jgi:Flp pilus assembly protein TadG
MSTTPSCHRGRRRGAVAAQAVVCFTVLLAAAALTLDGGILFTERQHAQAVADAAALAAAADLLQNYSSNNGTDPYGTAAASALSTASADGYSNDGTTSTVTVNVSPNNYQGGPNAGTKIPAGYVEVIVTYNQPRYFSGVWSSDTIPVSARAVARGSYTPGSAGILLLEPHGTALTISGLATIGVPYGSFVANSDGSTANVFSSTALTRPFVKAVEYDFVVPSGSSTLGLSNPTTALGSTSGGPPAINYGQPPMADPLASLPVPSTSGMTTYSNPNYTSGTHTLDPGVYTGGITVSGSGTNVTLNAGTYYLSGGGFLWSSSGTLTATSGVTIYVTGVTGTGTPAFKASSGTILLSPPSSGTYKGVSYFQDPSSTAYVQLTGSSGWNLQGTLYGYSAQFKLSGLSSTSSTSYSAQIIANSLYLSGNAAINLNSRSTAQEVRAFQLVE